MSTDSANKPAKVAGEMFPSVGVCMLLVGAYLLLAELGHALSFESKVATFWPPSGLSLSALLLAPKRAWPRLILAILAANLISDVFFHDKTLWQSLGFATANLSVALLGAFLYKSWFPKRATLASFSEVAAFVLLCCILATQIGATIGAAVLQVSFELNYWESWRVWWSGDAIGMIVFAPLFLLVLSPQTQRPKDWQEYALLGMLVLLIAGVTQLVVGQQTKPIATLIVPLLIVAALRFKVFGAALGVAAMTIVAVWATSQGSGLFASLGDLGEQALSLQIYIATMAISALTLAAAAMERDQQAQLLEGQRELKRTILDTLPAYIWFKDTNNRILKVNQAAADATGLPRDEIEGKAAEEIYPEQAERYHEGDRQVMASGVPLQGIVEELKGKGGTRWMSIDKHPVRDANDEIEGIVVVATDITERRQSERQLRLNQFTTDHSTNAVYWARPDGSFAYANAAACKMLGYTSEELLERRVSDIAAGVPPEKWPAHWNRVKENGSIGIETQHVGSDGIPREVALQINYVNYEDEEFLVATAHDITLRKHQEQELARVKEQLQLAITGGNVGLWDWDIQSETVYYSPEFHDQLGEPRGTLSGLDAWKSRLHPEDLEKSLQRVEDQFAGTYADADYEQTFRMQHADGSYRWIRTLGQLLRDPLGNPLRMIGVHVDVTENQELLAKIQRAYRELDSFTYVASHDLKAPLRAIDNLSRWIADDLADQIPEQSAEHLSILQQRAQRMELLLDDLLAYSRVGRKRFEPEEVDTEHLVRNAFELVAPTEGFRLTTNNMPRLATVRPPLELCLRNLIDNAIKHHDRGGGCITVECEGQPHFYKFSVSDDGAGIPEQFHERIFGMFQSLKPRDQVEGSGIGLTMLKKTVEHYGGQLTLESSPGAGSTFSFTWPKSLQASVVQVVQEAY